MIILVDYYKPQRKNPYPFLFGFFLELKLMVFKLNSLSLGVDDRKIEFYHFVR